METLDPNFSPNKRPKIESETLNPPISPSSDKGKAPISDEDNDGYESPVDLPPQNCGVCFSEEGKSVRGLIDSCNHYFCFLCIIEWSKIESRCPLCRGRFSTIRRMRKDGTFIGDGCVRIPVRDQIYDPFGEPVDPYAQVKCTVCNGTADESLLLLCDLCDSPWHTYCVGLGFTVPEGDWYCRDCALIQAEQDDGEMNDTVNNSDGNVDRSTTLKCVGEEPTTGSVSIFDIVREPVETTKPERGVARLRKLVSPTKKFSCPTITSARANNAHAESLESAGGNLKPQIDVTESSARTLHNCRNVRQHINILRDNWDAFRTGSLSFSSGLLGSRRKDGGKTNATAKCAERSRESYSISTPSSVQSKAQDTSSNVNNNPYDVDKAWKLMNIAKSMQHVGKSKSPSKSKVASYKAAAGKTYNVAAQCVPFGRKDVSSCALRMQSPHDNASQRHPERSGKHRLPSVVPRAVSTSSGKSQNFHISKLSLSRNVQTPVQDVIQHDRAGIGLPTFLNDEFACSTSSHKPKAETSNVSRMQLRKKEIPNHPQEQFRSADNFAISEAAAGVTDNICLTSPTRSRAGTSDISGTNICNKQMSTPPDKRVRDADNCSTSLAGAQISAQADFCNNRAGFPSVQKLGGGLLNAFDECVGAGCSIYPTGHVTDACNASHGKLYREVSACPSKIGAKTSDEITKDDEAKSEIQSLVKLNLKLLSKDRRLGADAFKDIARVSTHTILAACGFQHRKIVRSFPTLACNHRDQIQQLSRSTLMPSSCRECFYLFVKNVVNSIMTEKLDSFIAC